GVLPDRPDDHRQPEEVGVALAEDERDPHARRHRARDLQPQGAAGPLEEGGSRARQARHPDAGAVGRRLEEVHRRRSPRKSRAHEGPHAEGGRHRELRQGREALHTGVKYVVKGYDTVILGMAVLAAFLMAAMMVVICLDVLLRNLGYQSSAHFFTFTEYALLMVPCLGAPWLVREKGHIYVEILLMSLPPR